MEHFFQWLLAFAKFARLPIAAIAIASGFALFAPEGWLSFLSLTQEVAHYRSAVGMSFLLSASTILATAIQTLFGLFLDLIQIAVTMWLPKILKRRNSKRVALKNIDANGYGEVLRFLKTHNLKRIPVGDSQLLYLMEKDHFLIKDLDCSIASYYVVPNYIWNAIDKRLKDRPVAASPPWMPPPEEIGRFPPRHQTPLPQKPA